MVEISKMNLSKQSYIQINACRLYLRVANPDGRIINNHFLEGTKPLSPRSTFRWPNQPFPSQKNLKCMEKNCKKIIQHQREQFAPYSPTINTMDSPVFIKTKTTSMKTFNRKRRGLWDTQQQQKIVTLQSKIKCSPSHSISTVKIVAPPYPKTPSQYRSWEWITSSFTNNSPILHHL